MADDECVMPGARATQPTPRSLYTSETAEAIHTGSPLGERLKVQRDLRVYGNPLPDRGLNE